MLPSGCRARWYLLAGTPTHVDPSACAGRLQTTQVWIPLGSDSRVWSATRNCAGTPPCCLVPLESRHCRRSLTVTPVHGRSMNVCVRRVQWVSLLSAHKHSCASAACSQQCMLGCTRNMLCWRSLSVVLGGWMVGQANALGLSLLRSPPVVKHAGGEVKVRGKAGHDPKGGRTSDSCIRRLMTSVTPAATRPSLCSIVPLSLSACCRLFLELEPLAPRPIACSLARPRSFVHAFASDAGVCWVAKFTV